MKTTSVRVNAEAAEAIRAGQPVIPKDSVRDMSVFGAEGTLLRLEDPTGRYVATGYHGQQNKGAGWVLSRNERETIDREFFSRKIREAADRRNPFFENPDTTAFRVFNGEGDGIGGMTIDHYEGHWMVSWYSEGIYSMRQFVYESLKEMPGVLSVHEKKRFDLKGRYMEQDDFVSGKQPEFPLIVKENGMNFAVDLNDGAMTGIFLDQRDVRKAIRDEYAEGRSVLNTFSYTGAFSVAAALGGASGTVSVDLAKRSLPKTIEQFAVNGIDYEAQDIVVMDVFDYFRYARRKELEFDLVVLDPPSFARSKKRTFSAAKDYANLLEDVLAITAKGGIVVASTNHAGFGMKKFRTFIDKAFQTSGRKYRILKEYRLPEDFRTPRNSPESDYLKVAVIKADS
ncbi:23S rRNA (cytosine1962-C5)-methyltransferase [Bhargavaea ginsengi]|uniref:23S rRNA (Cytosine1962-C5)-methyltransferase n=1 Tax=Bhargavaea ginsengi TaxID=426757 RepID=A0A1H7BUU7_9BACL|nr:class I SAM-dependent rRNA methyltransferase [Bhargavaea ginsengi]SEJ81241.1 23S rRNA (cytosine1962-C5)-methyltransferase [Bhargavaea ginsengi]